MSRTIRFGILVLGLVFLAAPSFAEESAAPASDATAATTGSDAVPATTDAATGVTVEGETAAPAAPAPVAPPALKPITITFSGEVASVSSAENPPMITIQDRYGVKKEISVPAEAAVTAGTASKALADLKGGDKVTVEYKMTVYDSTILSTGSWSAEFPWKLDNNYDMYEYACHEGNTAIRNYIETSRFERANKPAAPPNNPAAAPRR